MGRKLLKAALILFPLTGLYCVAAGVLIQAFNEGSSRPFEVALHYSRIYFAGALLSLLAFITCLITLIKSKRKRPDARQVF